MFVEINLNINGFCLGFITFVRIAWKIIFYVTVEESVVTALFAVPESDFQRSLDIRRKLQDTLSERTL
jgi:hypothetical protein